MALGDPINVRLDESVRAVLERQAAARGVPFSAFLRGLLTDGAQADATLAGDSPGDPVLLEILLLLRSASGPERVRMAQAEVKRCGMVPWQSAQTTGGTHA